MISAKFQCSEPGAKQKGKDVEFKPNGYVFTISRVLQAINFIFAYSNIIPR
jgi:hypothetical protein